MNFTCTLANTGKARPRGRRTVEIDRRPARFGDASRNWRNSPTSAPLRYFFAGSKQKCVTTTRSLPILRLPFRVSSLLAGLFVVPGNLKRCLRFARECSFDLHGDADDAPKVQNFHFGTPILWKFIGLGARRKTNVKMEMFVRLGVEARGRVCSQ